MRPGGPASAPAAGSSTPSTTAESPTRYRDARIPCFSAPDRQPLRSQHAAADAHANLDLDPAGHAPPEQPATARRELHAHPLRAASPHAGPGDADDAPAAEDLDHGDAGRRARRE